MNSQLLAWGISSPFSWKTFAWHSLSRKFLPLYLWRAASCLVAASADEPRPSVPAMQCCLSWSLSTRNASARNLNGCTLFVLILSFLPLLSCKRDYLILLSGIWFCSLLYHVIDVIGLYINMMRFKGSDWSDIAHNYQLLRRDSSSVSSFAVK